MFNAINRDPLDRGILHQLRENARQTTAELARKLNVARSTINDRIARLERDGVIQGYTVVLESAEERPIRSLLFLKVEQSRVGRVVEQLRDFPEVKNCMALSGEFDLYCTIEAPQLEDIDAVLDEIGALPFVTRTHSDVVLANKFDRETVQQSRNAIPFLKAINS